MYRRVNKLCYNHIIEYYVAIKKTEEDIYNLIWSDFQNTLLNIKEHL